MLTEKLQKAERVTVLVHAQSGKLTQEGKKEGVEERAERKKTTSEAQEAALFASTQLMEIRLICCSCCLF